MTIERVKYATESGASVDMMIDGQLYTVNTGDALLLYGLTEWIAAGSAIDPFYTIVRAEYNRPDNQDVITIYTKEAGRVSFGKENEYLWKLKDDWIFNGGKIGPFVDRGKEAREAAEAEAKKEKNRKDLLDAMLEKGITPESILNR